jgi:hypothetical protein
VEVVEVEGGWGVVRATGSCVFVNRAVKMELNILLAARRGLQSAVSAVAVECEGGGAEVCCGVASELKPSFPCAGGRGGEKR